MAQKSPQREEVKAMVREALAGRVEAATVDESIKTVITELDVREVPEGGELVIGEGAIVTPSARDLIQERGIRLSHRARSSGSQAVKRMIGVGSDHGGFEMKEELKRLLADLGYRFRDFGTSSTEAVDYPDFAHAGGASRGRWRLRPRNHRRWSGHRIFDCGEQSARRARSVMLRRGYCS